MRRWSDILQEYNYDIEYKKGSEQGCADGLSQIGIKIFNY